jgi:hypothetical protein
MVPVPSKTSTRPLGGEGASSASQTVLQSSAPGMFARRSGRPPVAATTMSGSSARTVSASARQLKRNCTPWRAASATR